MPYTIEGTPYSARGTSHVAAEMIIPHVGSLCGRILYYMRNFCFNDEGVELGTTQLQAEDALGCKHQTLSPRFREMEFDGRVIKTPYERITPGGGNYPRDIYILGFGVPAGVPHIAQNLIDWSTKPLGPLDIAIMQTMFPRPRTDEMMENMLGRKHQSISGNRRHLVQRGMVESCGVTMNTTGRPAKLWGLNDYGLRALRQHQVPFASFRGD